MSREKILPLLIILMILTSSFNLLELDYIKKDNSEKRDEDIVEKPQISPWIWTPDADITITIYEATDEKLKFTYSANLDLTGLVEYWGHGIYRIDVYIYATYGGVEIFDVFSNDFAYGSFLLGETLEVDRIKGISLGHLLDLGYENIRIRVHVHRQLNFIVIPVWDSNYIDTYIDLTDDDIKAPKFQYANYDLSKIMQSIGPYEITFEYRDDHPWEGEIECEFRDLATNNLRGTYNTIDKLQPNDENICNFQIPKSTWFLYPDSRIVFRTRAIDKDMDGGRTHDREQSEWEDWQNANKILSRVGGSIDSVQAYAYIDGWKLVSLSPTSSNTHFQSIYLYDNNYFTISILNPAGENLIILKASINFTCPLFDQPFRYYFPIDVNKPIQPGEIFSNSVRVKFDPDDLDMGNWDSPTMKLNFSFQFSMESNPSVVTSYKEIAEFQIIKAPEPTFKFIGFKTPFDESIEGERFTYKTRKTSTSIYSTFEICNNARIPINISQDFDFISGTNEYEISKIREIEDYIKQKRVNSFETHQLTFLIRPDTIFFTDEDLWLSFIFQTFALPVPKWIKRILDTSIKAKDLTKEVLKAKLLKYQKWAGVFIDSFLALYNGFILEGSITSMDAERNFSFKSLCDWSYIHMDREVKEISIPNENLYYSQIIESTDELKLKPSRAQEGLHLEGISFRYFAVSYYAVAAAAYYAGNPAAGLAFALLADLNALISNIRWRGANDDPLKPLYYEELYKPNYTTPKIPNFVPKNEYEQLLLNNIGLNIRFIEHLRAINETELKIEAALKSGDYNATIKQKRALINFTILIKDDFKKLSNSFQLQKHFLEKFFEVTNKSLTEIESIIAQNGLPQEEIERMRQIGFNETEIDILNRTSIEYAKRGEFSGNFSNSVNNIHPFIDMAGIEIVREIGQLENYTHRLINDTIHLQITKQNQSIQTEDGEILFLIESLKGEILDYNASKRWHKVIEASDDLIKIVEKAALEMNNHTYIEEYILFSQKIRDEAKSYININIFHLERLTLRENEDIQINIIAEAHGLHSETYQLITNSSWVQPSQGFIEILDDQRTIISLNINTSNIENLKCRNYDVNFQLRNVEYEIYVDSKFIVSVVDDDSSPPNIVVNYTGDYTDGNSGLWKINITDEESGIEEIQIYFEGEKLIHLQDLQGIPTKYFEIPLPNELGLHKIDVFATNWDTDRANDEESVLKNYSLNILDDDTNSPVISISYIGGNIDERPGYFEWNIIDIDNGIGGDNDVGFSQLNITVDYSSIEGLEDYTLMLPSSSSGLWNLPPSLGEYTLSIFATDNDNDRALMLDFLSSEIGMSQNIYDDDINQPEVSNLVIVPDIFNINISFSAFDNDSGIGNIKIFVNKELIEPISSGQLNNSFNFVLKNRWASIRGLSDVEVIVGDNDYDRPFDSLSAVLYGSFKNTLFQMYDYIDWQMRELIKYIEDNMNQCLSNQFNVKLQLAQNFIQKAYNYTENGDLTRNLDYIIKAKYIIGFLICKIKMYQCCGWITDEIATILIYELFMIKENMIILMGTSTGKAEGYEFGYIEVDLIKLSKLVRSSVKHCFGVYLAFKLKTAAQIIENSLFRITEGKCYSILLNCVLYKLSSVEKKINYLLIKQRIKVELADLILENINRISNLLEDFK